jgi:hypothetical protein
MVGDEWMRGADGRRAELGRLSQAICPDISGALALGRLSRTRVVSLFGGSGHGNLSNIVCHVLAPAVSGRRSV